MANLIEEIEVLRGMVTISHVKWDGLKMPLLLADAVNASGALIAKFDAGCEIDISDVKYANHWLNGAFC